MMKNLCLLNCCACFLLSLISPNSIAKNRVFSESMERVYLSDYFNLGCESGVKVASAKAEAWGTEFKKIQDYVKAGGDRQTAERLAREFTDVLDDAMDKLRDAYFNEEKRMLEGETDRMKKLGVQTYWAAVSFAISAVIETAKGDPTRSKTYYMRVAEGICKSKNTWLK
jgi:hypothetical protein